MLFNRLLLLIIVFSLSSLLSLISQRNLKLSLGTGLISAIAGYTGMIISDNQRIKQEKLRRNSLQYQIQRLEKEEIQLYQSLASANSIKQQLEANIGSLSREKAELNKRIIELHHERNQLHQEFTRLQQEYRQQEVTIISQQDVIVNQQDRLLQFEKQQKITPYIHPSQQRINYLRSRLEELHKEIDKKEIQQQQTKLHILSLEKKLQNLQGEEYDLRTQILVSRQRQQEIDDLVQKLAKKQEEAESSLQASRVNLEAIITEIKNKEGNVSQLNSKIQQLTQQKQELESKIQELTSNIEVLTSTPVSSTFVPKIADHIPQEWQEWLDFVHQLSTEEQQILKAILEEDEVTLKTIADQRITMPEVLIESLNYQALQFLGDTPFSCKPNSLIPQIHEEYLPILSELIMVKS